MIHAAYYRDGRGVVPLRAAKPLDIKGLVFKAKRLIDKVASVHHHQPLIWTAGQRGASARCPGCGQTAVVTLAGSYLFVDTSLHTKCALSQPDDAAALLAA